MQLVLKYKMTLTIIQPTRRDIAQAMLGFGDVPIYAGSLSQKGYGIGGVVKRFVAAMRPLFTKTAAKAVEGVKRGALGVVGDAMKGKSIEASIKKHAFNEGKRLLGDSLSEVVVGEPARKRRRTATKRTHSVKKAGRHRRPVSGKGTIFG